MITLTLIRIIIRPIIIPFTIEVFHKIEMESVDEVRPMTRAIAIRSCTTSSAHAMHARETHGLSTLICRVFPLIWINRFIYFQLRYVVTQLHHSSFSRNVCFLSCLLAIQFDLPSQLPVTHPIRRASTRMGLYRHICAYIPLPFGLLSQEIVLKILGQTSNFSVSEAQAVGGARPFHSL